MPDENQSAARPLSSDEESAFEAIRELMGESGQVRYYGANATTADLPEGKIDATSQPAG